uniref:Clc-like protein n=1 Tax=Meloidogyne incognita TaxID=6306 RepID=A0A914LZ68_MELIC
MQNQTTSTGWLICFLLILIFATTSLILGLLTPSWQIVYLEEGRTEHHHGLWLDCKRDYSYDYGRSKEYYATLHRHFDLARPFDQFWLTALNCVFKFDYWLDEKDWYELGYDENRLWGDAYQHLFLGWKIATLVANLISTICAIFAIIFLIFAFCHRLCTCIAAVLVVISVLSSIAGNLLFFMFASDQDNNIIKEEEGIYEQHFGWSFWISLFSNILMLICSITGCIATKAAFGKNRSEKFMKIKMQDLEDDNCGAHLLKNFSGTIASTGQTSICSQQEPKRDFNNSRRCRSPIYKIESQQLKQWERESMHNIKNKTKTQQQTRNLNNKRERNIFEPSLNTPTDSDVVYEYVDWNNFGGENFVDEKNKKYTQDESNRHYDPVPLAPENTTFSIGKPFLFNSDNEYLQPKSLTIDTSTISTRAGGRTTTDLFLTDNDPIKTSPPQLLSRISKQTQFGNTSNFNVDNPELVKTQKSSQFIKEFKESEKRFAKIPKVTFSKPLQQNGLPKPFVRSRSSHRLYSPSQSSILTDVKPIVDDQRIGWSSNGIKRIPSEMDRSIGSSRVDSFLFSTTIKEDNQQKLSSSLQERKEEWTDV